MFIAQKLKKENICEYLLYMWQLEDILRALKLDIEEVNAKLVQPYSQLDVQKKKELYEWYESLMDMMRMENVQTSGHLQININTLSEIDEFHQKLLQSGKDSKYSAVSQNISLHLFELRKKSNPNISDIELCFNFQYGILLLKLKKEKITPQTLEIHTEVSSFMKMLAVNFKKFKNGELSFEE